MVGDEVQTLRTLSAFAPASILRFHDVRQDSSFFYLITEVRRCRAWWDELPQLATHQAAGRQCFRCIPPAPHLPLHPHPIRPFSCA